MTVVCCHMSVCGFDLCGVWVSCHVLMCALPCTQTLVDNSMKVCDVVRTIASRFLIPDSERYSIQCLYGTQYVWLDSDQTR